MGCPIRTSSDHSLLNGSPKLFAVTPRPSSPVCVKASSVRPFFHKYLSVRSSLQKKARILVIYLMQLITHRFSNIYQYLRSRWACKGYLP